jgi:hypothetical protein
MARELVNRSSVPVMESTRYGGKGMTFVRAWPESYAEIESPSQRVMQSVMGRATHEILQVLALRS